VPTSFSHLSQMVPLACGLGSRLKKGLSTLGTGVQCVAVCCSVLQCVAVCCIVLHSVAVCCSESRLERCLSTMGPGVLQCIAVCGSGSGLKKGLSTLGSGVQCVAVCCSVLQYVAVCCIVLQ